MSKWARRLLIAAPIALLAGALGAPFLSAELYRERIRVNLERVLGRRVEAPGEARFRLYPRPGVSLTRVIIHELPELGVEPIAYLDYPESALNVSLAPLPLLLGQVKVTGVQLVAPSLNLNKAANGGWSFQPLLERAIGQGRAAGFDLDALEVRGGRLNIKIDGVKSVFYLADSDLRLESDAADSRRYGLTIEGDPARTDRPVSAFGRLSGRGMLTLGGPGEAESRIDLNVAIGRTPIAEIVTALGGRGAALGGFLASQARLSGPLSSVLIDGRIELAEAERFGWLLPRSTSARGLPYSGRLDWPGQELRLASTAADQAAAAVGPVAWRLRAIGLFQKPVWGALLGLRDAPLASVRALAGELGATLPSQTPVEGSMRGVVGYSSHRGILGMLAIAGAAVTVPGLATATLADARVIIDNSRWRVPATEIRFSEREALTVETGGDTQTGSRTMAIASAGTAIERSRPLWAFLSGAAGPALFERCGLGQWGGTLRFDQENALAPGTWQGDVRVSGLSCAIDGLASPATVESAQVAIRGPAVQARRFSAAVGTASFSGELTHDPRARPPTRLRLQIPAVSAADLERLLLPALRRERGLISRTLGRAAPAPEWLLARRLDAQVRIAKLALGPAWQAEAVDARATWTGTTIELKPITASVGGGAVAANLRIALDGAEPAYRGHLDLTGAAFHESRLDFSADGESGGLGWALLGGLQAQGRFSATGNPLLAAEPIVESGLGAFTFAAGRFAFSNLQVVAAGETWQGNASAGVDGRIQWEPASPGRRGRLW